MNEIFDSLPKDKRERIINAGLEVFSKNSYKKGSTDDVATKAGISKGSLFYYFKNKKTFYKFLFDYTYEFIYETMVQQDIWQYTDFFELAEKSGVMKLKISEQYPNMYAFIMNAYMDPDPEIHHIFIEGNDKMLPEIMNNIKKNIDYSKFKSEVDLKKLLNIIYWTGEGYLKEAAKKDLSFQEIQKEYVEYLDFFKSNFYE